MILSNPSSSNGSPSSGSPIDSYLLNYLNSMESDLRVFIQKNTTYVQGCCYINLYPEGDRDTALKLICRKTNSIVLQMLTEGTQAAKSQKMDKIQIIVSSKEDYLHRKISPIFKKLGFSFNIASISSEVSVFSAVLGAQEPSVEEFIESRTIRYGGGGCRCDFTEPSSWLLEENREDFQEAFAIKISTMIKKKRSPIIVQVPVSDSYAHIEKIVCQEGFLSKKIDCEKSLNHKEFIRRNEDSQSEMIALNLVEDVLELVADQISAESFIKSSISDSTDRSIIDLSKESIWLGVEHLQTFKNALDRVVFLEREKGKCSIKIIVPSSESYTHIHQALLNTQFSQKKSSSSSLQTKFVRKFVLSESEKFIENIFSKIKRDRFATSFLSLAELSAEKEFNLLQIKKIFAGILMHEMQKGAHVFALEISSEQTPLVYPFIVEHEFSLHHADASTVLFNKCLRPDLHKKEYCSYPKYHTGSSIGVTVVVFNLALDKLLAVKEVYGGIDGWKPITGAVDKNEEPVQAAIRELREETNVSLEENTALTLVGICHTKNLMWGRDDINYVYAVAVDFLNPETLHAQENEIAAVDLISYDQYEEKPMQSNPNWGKEPVEESSLTLKRIVKQARSVLNKEKAGLQQDITFWTYGQKTVEFVGASKEVFENKGDMEFKSNKEQEDSSGDETVVDCSIV